MLPRLAHVRRAAATATMRPDANIAGENARIIQHRALAEVVDPPHDGDCLFHSFYKCFENTPWMEEWAKRRAKINSVNDMRRFIVKYLRKYPGLFEAEHSDYIRNTAARWMERDVNSLTYEEAMPVYCDQMQQPTVWGGEPELDAGAMLLNVIVNQFFVPHRGGDLSTARLSASFYPTPEIAQEGNEAARASLTKFVFILKDGHYYFVLPRVPRALQVGSGSDGSASDESVSAQGRIRLLHDLRARNMVRDSSRTARRTKGNANLKALAAEREARSAARGGDACAWKPVTLTDEQREEMEAEDGDLAYARQLYQQELNDAALARELARQWD